MPKRKPITVKHGSVALRIYRIRNRRGRRLYRQYCVVHRIGPQRVREKFSRLISARQRARAIAEQLAKGETLVASLSAADHSAYVRSVQLLASTGVALETAAAQFAQAHELTRGNVLLAGQEWAARHPVGMSTRTVAEALAELLEEQRSIGSSQRHLADLRSRLDRFAAHFQCDIAAISGPEIANWLKSLDPRNSARPTTPRPQARLGLRSRNNYRAAVQSLMQFARTRKYLPPTWDGLDAVPHAKAPAGKVQVFSPDEMSELLTAAAAHKRKAVSGLVPWLALRAFCGIRSAEASRLTWPDVNLSGKWLILSPSITKTKVGRRIPIPPNLRRWLAQSRQKAGPIVSVSNVSNALVMAQRAAGMEPRHNALRDSFSSYAMAMHQNAAMVSEWTGNSPRRLKESYTALRLGDGRVITPELARRWFAINPPRRASNIRKVRFG